ncbi:MAG TPA: hypothetical protein VFP68_02970 [Burkholderiaceae bacterium]|nr:hypothetical protein [Burkholderiaceae bacterium]
MSALSWSTALETIEEDADDRTEAPESPLAARRSIPNERVAPHLNDEFLDATVPQRSDHSIHPDDIPLAGYLLARQVNGRPVEGEHLQLLRNAHDSVREARNLLPYGRGNVKEDAIATDGLSTFAVNQVRQEFDDLPVAVSALLGGAGNCEEYAALSSLAMAARLPPRAQARTVTRPFVDHVWSEASIDGNFKDRSHTVVIDGWRQGPAVFAPDHAHAAFTCGLRGHVIDHFESSECVTAEQHGTLLQSYKESAQETSFNGMNVEFPTRKLELDSRSYPLKLKSGVRTHFAKQAASRLEKEIRPEQAYARADKSVWRKMKAKVRNTKDCIVTGSGAMRCLGRPEPSHGAIPAALRSQIQSVGIARQLAPNMSPRELAAVAPRIVEAARTLALPVPSTARHPLDMRAEVARRPTESRMRQRRERQRG